jgi:hypothetical protein
MLADTLLTNIDTQREPSVSAVLLNEVMTRGTAGVIIADANVLRSRSAEIPFCQVSPRLIVMFSCEISKTKYSRHESQNGDNPYIQCLLGTAPVHWIGSITLIVPSYLAGFSWCKYNRCLAMWICSERRSRIGVAGTSLAKFHVFCHVRDYS